MLSCLRLGLGESIPARTWKFDKEAGMPSWSTSILLPADPQQRIARQVSSAAETTSCPRPPPSTSIKAIFQASASLGCTKPRRYFLVGCILNHLYPGPWDLAEIRTRYPVPKTAWRRYIIPLAGLHSATRYPVLPGVRLDPLAPRSTIRILVVVVVTAHSMMTQIIS